MLVVILMVAAPFVNPSVVNLPSVNKASKAPEKVVEVVVYPDGRLSLRAGKEMQPTDMPGLVAAVRSAQAGDATVPVVIAADKDVRYEDVVNVMKLLQSAEVERVGLSLKGGLGSGAAAFCSCCSSVSLLLTSGSFSATPDGSLPPEISSGAQSSA